MFSWLAAVVQLSRNGLAPKPWAEEYGGTQSSQFRLISTAVHMAFSRETLGLRDTASSVALRYHPSCNARLPTGQTMIAH